jgi:hypothetical protein
VTLSLIDPDGHVARDTAVAGEDDLRRDSRPERRTVCAAAVDLIQTLVKQATAPAISEDPRKQRTIGGLE